MTRTLQPSLATRLAAGLFVPLMLALTAGLVAWNSFDQARSEADLAQRQVLPALRTVYAAEQALQQASAVEAQWLAAVDNEERRALAAQWRARNDRILQRAQIHEALDPEDAQHAELFSQALRALAGAQERLMDNLNSPATHEQALAVSRHAKEAALREAEAWRFHVERWNDERAGASTLALSLRDVLTAGLMMAALAVSLISWYRLTRDIGQPLQQATQALQTLSRGHFDFALPKPRVPAMTQLLARIDALRDVVAFACEGDDEDALIADEERLAITARAVLRYHEARLPGAAGEPTPVAAPATPEGPTATAVPVQTTPARHAANDTMVQPA